VGEIVDARRRAASGAGRADRWSAAVLGLGFLVLAMACAARGDVAGMGIVATTCSPSVRVRLVEVRYRASAPRGRAVTQRCRIRIA
jgi:hypothetical protein